MASRVYKAGTIVSRTKCLLEVGVLKTPPLWFDILEALPPISLTTHNNPPNLANLQQITFPNDAEFKKLHQEQCVVTSRIKAISLFGGHEALAPPRPTVKAPFVKAQKHQLKVVDNAEAGLKGEESSAPPPPTATGLRRNDSKVNVKAASPGRPGLSPADELLKFLTEVDSFDEEMKK